MDVWRITLATLRRWYIFVPLLALTALGVLRVGEGVNPEYQVSASTLMTPGREPAMVPNPYGNLEQGSAAVAIVLNSSETRRGLEAEGLSSTYTVSAQARSAIMSISVTSGSPDVAVETGHALVAEIRDELAARQGAAGVHTAAQFGLQVLGAPEVTAITYEGKAQIQAVVGVLGAGIALLTAILFDDIVGLARRRRRKHSESRPSVGPRPGSGQTVAASRSDLRDGAYLTQPADAIPVTIRESLGDETLPSDRSELARRPLRGHDRTSVAST
ncbi:YveK family protein [Georgenia subflava]|uniref:Polysaccharide chain length determinant N-terminal domain-containing protein n=1 Tax=Georgenia subflava TaxID=1622177 RepID=A0A6N7EQH5_9MICO|nr:hypothetical protein [Georgenia subflava]MPV38765.1 hypothetical protein [Georgenia subflava]